MRPNKMEIASTLHTKGPREGTRELSYTDLQGTGPGVSRGASPRATPVSRGTMCPEQTAVQWFAGWMPEY